MGYLGGAERDYSADKPLGDLTQEMLFALLDYAVVPKGSTTAQIQAILDRSLIRPTKIIFMRGETYIITQKIYVRSNSDVDLNGATLLRSFNTGPGGVSLLQWDDSIENFTMKNGTLHGNGANYPGAADSTGFNIAGGTGLKNVLFENVTFRDWIGNHALDMNTIDGVTVRNCRFMGYKDLVGDRDYAEAIQLDPNTLSGTSGTNNKNVLIVNNYFGPSDTPGFGAPGSGVGNHASAVGRTDTNIRIRGNVFDGCGFAGVRSYGWDNVNITGNTFTGMAGRGIHITPMPKGATLTDSGRNYVIANNSFSGVKNPILFASPTVSAGVVPRFKNVAITGNTIENATGDALTVPYINGMTITGNTINNVATGIKIGYTLNTTISGNTCDTTVNANFIWITETSFETTLAGTGLTQQTSITGNNATNIGYRGIHINSAAKFTTITGNTFINVSTAASTREGIGADSGASYGLIEGNSILDGGAVNKPIYGISIGSGAGNFRIGPNNVFGTTRGTNNSSTTTTLTGVLVTGTPEGVLVGAVGSTCTRTDGGSLTTSYVKESGTGSTGWIAK